MSAVAIVGLGLVLASIVVMALIIFRLMQNVAYLIDHERTHCRQIGELQRHVSTLALILDNATTGVPRELIEFASQVQGE